MFEKVKNMFKKHSPTEGWSDICKGADIDGEPEDIYEPDYKAEVTTTYTVEVTEVTKHVTTALAEDYAHHATKDQIAKFIKFFLNADDVKVLSLKHYINDMKKGEDNGDLY